MRHLSRQPDSSLVYVLLVGDGVRTRPSFSHQLALPGVRLRGTLTFGDPVQGKEKLAGRRTLSSSPGAKPAPWEYWYRIASWGNGLPYRSDEAPYSRHVS